MHSEKMIKEEWNTSIVWHISFCNKQWKLLLAIGFICTNFDNFPHSSVGWSVG